jgi:uncharacterized protein (DUF983 family)
MNSTEEHPYAICPKCNDGALYRVLGDDFLFECDKCGETSTSDKVAVVPMQGDEGVTV